MSGADAPSVAAPLAAAEPVKAASATVARAGDSGAAGAAAVVGFDRDGERVGAFLRIGVAASHRIGAGVPLTVPVVGAVPSPQSIVAVKSAVWSPGLASVKVALVSDADAPSRRSRSPRSPVKAASATVAVPVMVVLLGPAVVGDRQGGRVGAFLRIGVAAGDGVAKCRCCR